MSLNALHGEREAEPTGPAVLRDCDLRKMLGISADCFFRRKAARAYTCFELEPVAGTGRTEYSAHLVNEWLRTGDLPRRFFRGARRPAVVRTGKPGRPRKQQQLASHPAPFANQ